MSSNPFKNDQKKGVRFILTSIKSRHGKHFRVVSVLTFFKINGDFFGSTSQILVINYDDLDKIFGKCQIFQLEKLFRCYIFLCSLLCVVAPVFNDAMIYIITTAVCILQCNQIVGWRPALLQIIINFITFFIILTITISTFLPTKMNV